MEDAQVAYNTRGVRLEGARALGALPWASENAAVGAFVLRLFRFVIARVKRIRRWLYISDAPAYGCFAFA